MLVAFLEGGADGFGLENGLACALEFLGGFHVFVSFDGVLAALELELVVDASGVTISFSYHLAGKSFALYIFER